MYNNKSKFLKVVDRIWGFFIAAGVVGTLAALALLFIIVRGPSEALRDKFVTTISETRRFGFVNHIWLDDSTVEEIMSARLFIEDSWSSLDTELPEGTAIEIQTPVSLDEYEQLKANIEAEFGVTDDDDDGVIHLKVSGTGFAGHMMMVLDPRQVILGQIDLFGMGVYGKTVLEMCEKYGALGGMNAGGFEDPNGEGFGGEPTGPIYSEGKSYNTHYTVQMVALDKDGKMSIDVYDAQSAIENNIMNGTSFGPVLIRNGVPVAAGSASGTSPRTCIGQRADGVILMLVIDGRQSHSMGCDFNDLTQIMMDYGAVNAYNMDGGSSSVMCFGGEVINSPSARSGLRPNPTAWLIMPKSYVEQREAS